MYSPHRFRSRVGNTGIPLPDPFHTLSLRKVHFRRGATSLIAGAPGSFKSVFALNIVAEWGLQGIGIQYFSADSDEFTVVKRLSGILTGDSIDAVEANLAKGRYQKYEDELRRLVNVEFEYKQMDVDQVSVHIKQYEAVYGNYPDVVFLDNLIDFVDSPDDWGGMLALTKELDALARQIGSHICVLHHAKLAPGKQDRQSPSDWKPPADWEIQGKITQIPRLALTMAAQGMTMRVACVKNTNGPQNREGSDFFNLQILNSMKVLELDYQTGRV